MKKWLGPAIFWISVVGGLVLKDHISPPQKPTYSSPVSSGQTPTNEIVAACAQWEGWPTPAQKIYCGQWFDTRSWPPHDPSDDLPAPPMVINWHGVYVPPQSTAPSYHDLAGQVQELQGQVDTLQHDIQSGKYDP